MVGWRWTDLGALGDVPNRVCQSGALGSSRFLNAAEPQGKQASQTLASVSGRTQVQNSGTDVFDGDGVFHRQLIGVGM